jgi:signal peptidase I
MTTSPQHELKLSGSDLHGIMFSVLEKGTAFRFRAKGVSMSPFIRNGDILTIARLDDGGARPGDIVVVNHAGRSVIVHRVIKASAKDIILKGDNCSIADGTFVYTSIVGKVTTIERDGRKVGFHSGSTGRLIAFVSATGLLNGVLLPFLRRMKRFTRQM